MSYGNDRGGYEDRNRGAMFPRQKKSDRSPDMGGDITITDDVLDYIVQNARSGSVKISVSAWRAMSRGNKAFTKLAVSVPFERDEQPQRRPQRQPQREYQRPRQQQMDYGREERPRDYNHSIKDEEFARGDRMPDFDVRRRDDDTPPWA